VWTLEMQKVTKEYGVSDGTLGTTCKKLHVPVPGVGYWNKKTANKPVNPRPPLPQFVEGIGDRGLQNCPLCYRLLARSPTGSHACQYVLLFAIVPPSRSYCLVNSDAVG
jgi:hypothetical protein